MTAVASCATHGRPADVGAKSTEADPSGLVRSVPTRSHRTDRIGPDRVGPVCCGSGS